MKGFFLNADFKKGKHVLSKKRKPYLKKICRVARIEVWLVDGEYIRKNICEDFVNYDHHFHLPLIPRNEFWISKDTAEDEVIFYIIRMFAEHRFISSGATYNEASGRAAAIERRERGKSELVKKIENSCGGKEKPLKKVYRCLIKKYGNGIAVWLVSGDLVRSLIYTDFAGGGHDRVYHFIPENQVWIDDDIRPEERKFIILHEIHERSLMSRGMNYPHAHKEATEVEDFFRHHPRNIGRAIYGEVRKQN